MKIIFVTELFLPSLGGQEVRYAELASYLSSRGHDVRIITIAHQEGLKNLEKKGHVIVERIVESLAYTRKLSSVGREPVSILRFSICLLLHRWKELLDADAVIFNKWPLVPQMLVGLSLNVRSVVDWCEIRSGWGWQVAYGFMCYSSKLHIGVSSEIVDHLVGAYGISKTGSLVAVSGVDVECFSRGSVRRKNKQILFFGRLSAHKDPLILVRTFLEFFPVESGYHLIIAGGGELIDEIQNLVKAQTNIEVRGKITDDEKVQLLRESALLVLPSKREGFPRVIAEAAAAGTPTLTTIYPMNGGASVVREYGIGQVCTPNPESLKTAIIELSEIDSLIWRKLSQACLIQAKNVFDWARVVNSLIDFFRDGFEIEKEVV